MTGPVVALQSEVSVRPIYEGMPDWREAVRSIEALGFSLSGRFPVSRTERLEQRVRVLEQLATDRGVDTAAQIEALRDFKRIEDKAPAR